ncbi:MAG: N-6 DNA methylase [Cytophagaceae bacterium]|nr:N-6 DNA methylase [Cytophagaceae bacterium]
MSTYLIQQYHRKVQQLVQYGQQHNEGNVSHAFGELLNAYAEKRDLLLIPQYHLKARSGKTIIPDGAVKDRLSLLYGLWESKDTKDDLRTEMEKKFSIGYPSFNILFEDSRQAILVQGGQEVGQVELRDAPALDQLLTRFVEYERPEVRTFREAVERFRQDLPVVIGALQEMIAKQAIENATFKAARAGFWKLCRESINADLSLADVDEMLIQHILTEDIFVSIFSESQFHQENNIARELRKVEETFFTGTTKRQTLDRIQGYYEVIRSQAGTIADHHEKQTFLKHIYENFYKAYDPKKADKLGVVYTPNEIVQFQIKATDYLLNRHFHRSLSDPGVRILDPATGTGTYLTALIDYLDPHTLPHKYREELFANEIAILPYYIANLNVEYIFRQRMGYYAEFPNLCFVDTLDNLGFNFGGQQTGLGFGFSAENVRRIHHQNAQKISVVLGNPPYNANQLNENDNNKNREYFADGKKKIGGVDGRIRATYIARSTAQKTKVYDMYARFYRWASDRLQNGPGIVSFITNRSFIDSRTFDGFRHSVAEEFDAIYIVDTRSDVRANPKISGTKHNVFGIQTGVAVMFLVKTGEVRSAGIPADIRYFTLHDEQTKTEKLDWFRTFADRFSEIPFQPIRPDANANWIDQTDNDFESLLPLCSKEVKALDGKNTELERVVFKSFANGIKTNRDEWVYEFDGRTLSKKIKYFTEKYNRQLQSKAFDNDQLDYSIKWSRDLKIKLQRGRRIVYQDKLVCRSMWRPFVKQFFYREKILCDVLTEHHFEIFGPELDAENTVISFSGLSSAKPFQTLASDGLSDYEHVEKSVNLPLYRYDAQGRRIENITNWALNQFREQYEGNGLLAARAANSPLPSYCSRN